MRCLLIFLVLLFACKTSRVKKPTSDACPSLNNQNNFPTEESYKEYNWADIRCSKDPSNITPSQLDQWIEKASILNASQKIVYLDREILSTKQTKKINLSHFGALKALFHTSFNQSITGIEDVSDGHCLVYLVDLQVIWGDSWEANWAIINGEKAHVFSDGLPSQQPFVSPSTSERDDYSRNRISTKRLAYLLVYPTNYLYLAKIPSSFYDMDVEQKILLWEGI